MSNRTENDNVNDSQAIEQREAEDLLDGETAAEAVSLSGGLSRGQAAALGVLTSGGSIAGAARAAGVTRRTVYGWMEAGRALGEAYAQWKASIAETARTRLLMIGEAATVQIARAVRQGDTKTALAVAKGMGLLAPPAVGPSLAQIEARRREAEAAREEEEREERVRESISFAELVEVEGILEEGEDGEEDGGINTKARSHEGTRQC